MTELSPAAQAVLKAAAQAMECPDGFLPYEQELMAAALRAAADQLTPYSVEEMRGAAVSRNKLLAIAKELEDGTFASSTHLELGDE